MSNEFIYHGRVFCAVTSENSEFEAGMRGAFIPICCKAETYSSAVKKIETELLELHLTLQGIEELYDNRYFYGTPSEEMEGLIESLELYPVQYKNVHYFPPNG